jgi:hypothetical protein
MGRRTHLELSSTSQSSTSPPQHSRNAKRKSPANDASHRQASQENPNPSRVHGGKAHRSERIARKSYDLEIILRLMLESNGANDAIVRWTGSRNAIRDLTYGKLFPASAKVFFAVTRIHLSPYLAIDRTLPAPGSIVPRLAT